MILESEKDRYTKKVIFFAGIPGAGKSTIINSMFGFDKNINLSIYNAKKVNPDIFIERKYKGQKIDWSKNTEKIANEFERAQELRDKSLEMYKKSKLPIVIDGVGRYVDYILDLAQDFKKDGYSVYMIFVNTDLKEAIKRNEERARSVEKKFIEASHSILKDNYNAYKEYFGKNFFEIDNNKKLDESGLQKIGRRIMS